MRPSPFQQHVNRFERHRQAMAGYLLLILMQLVLQFSHGQLQIKFFRKDYKYLEETQNFYKIHTIPKTWDNAKRKCAMEGAQLWFPLDQSEADTVFSYLNQTQSKINFIYVGISSRFAKGVFRTIDGTAMRNIYNVWAVGEPNDLGGNEDCVVIKTSGYYYDDKCSKKYPFICKKALSSLKWNEDCNVYDKGYKYNKDLGRCYKLHLNPLTWRDAFETCDAEQSNLAIVNSEEEVKYLINITENAPKKKVTGSYLQGQIHLGFSYDASENDWRTTSGETLEEAGYAIWGLNQPNGGENERCGSMFYDGRLNDIGCEAHKCFFICERENEILSILDEKFGRISETGSH